MQWLRHIIEHPRFERFIVGVIIVNAITLGMETSKELLASYGHILHAIDRIALAIFVFELLAKLLIYRVTFFRSGWNIFDFLIVVLTTLPFLGNISVLRALRILRVFRLFSIVPQFRIVVEGFFASLSGLVPVAGVLLILMYVFAVVSTKLFQSIAPEYFGSLPTSLFTMFQLMTLESWVTVVDTVQVHFAWAPLFFIVYILVTTFTVLNLLIGVVVTAMQVQERQRRDEMEVEEELLTRIESLSKEIHAIARRIGKTER